MGNTAGPIGSLQSSSDSSIAASQPFLLKWLEASLRVRKKGNCSPHLPTDFTTWQCLSASQMEDREPATAVDKIIRNRVNSRQMLWKTEKASIGWDWREGLAKVDEPYTELGSRILRPQLLSSWWGLGKPLNLFGPQFAIYKITESN